LSYERGVGCLVVGRREYLASFGPTDIRISSVRSLRRMCFLSSTLGRRSAAPRSLRARMPCQAPTSPFRFLSELTFKEQVVISAALRRFRSFGCKTLSLLVNPPSVGLVTDVVYPRFFFCCRSPFSPLFCPVNHKSGPTSSSFLLEVDFHFSCFCQMTSIS